MTINFQESRLIAPKFKQQNRRQLQRLQNLQGQKSKDTASSHRKSCFRNIPSELLSLIISFLPFRFQLARISLVSKKWRSCSHGNYFFYLRGCNVGMHVSVSDLLQIPPSRIRPAHLLSIVPFFSGSPSFENAVRALDFSWIHQLDDVLFASFLGSSSQAKVPILLLESINLALCERISDSSLFLLAEHVRNARLPNLIRINLFGCPRISHQGVNAIIFAATAAAETTKKRESEPTGSRYLKYQRKKTGEISITIEQCSNVNRALLVGIS